MQQQPTKQRLTKQQPTKQRLTKQQPTKQQPTKTQPTSQRITRTARRRIASRAVVVDRPFSRGSARFVHALMRRHRPRQAGPAAIPGRLGCLGGRDLERMMRPGAGIGVHEDKNPALRRGQNPSWFVVGPVVRPVLLVSPAALLRGGSFP